MAFGRIPSSFLPCLLLTLCFYSTAADGRATQQSLQGFRRLLRIGNSLPSHHCEKNDLTRKENSLPLTHMHGPCSPFAGNDGSRITPPSLGDILDSDKARFADFRRRIMKHQTSAAVTIPGKSGEAMGFIGFVATFGIGFPPVPQTVQIDSGSDLCWVYSVPCIGACHQQMEPLFNPLISATHSAVPCNSARCGELYKNSCMPTTGACLFSQRYADTSGSSGYLAKDTLTLAHTDAVAGFLFGCAGEGTGFREKVAGVFGFSRGGLSIVSQLSGTRGNGFSYCLPGSPAATGHISIGRSGWSSPPTAAVQQTPMLTDPLNPSFYFVELLGVIISGQRLDVQPTSRAPYDTIVDSGTSFTYVPKATYAALRAAFTAAMAIYRPAVVDGMDACYDFTGLGAVHVPSLVLQLRGATLDLPSENVVYMVGERVGCLAFRPSGAGVPLNIIGYVQLKTYEVVHDLDAKTIAFVGGAC